MATQPKTKRSLQKKLLIGAVIGLFMYVAAEILARLYATDHADANIGAGLLAIAGLAVGSVLLMIFIFVTLFKKH